MSKALEQARELLADLTVGEKAQLLQWVALDLAEATPGVESTPGVCGGEPCIVRTRIPVWVLEQARRLGTPDDVILRAYAQRGGTPATDDAALVERLQGERERHRAPERKHRQRRGQGRRVRVGQKAVRQIPHQVPFGDRADDFELAVAVAGFVIDKFADARLHVVARDESEFVRVFAWTFDCADEEFLHKF